jgi:general secretion pathway protein D
MIGQYTSRRLLTRSSWRRLLLGTALSVLFGLTGCAGQAYLREGKGLLEQGRIEEGLAKIQQAVDADPRSGEFRRALTLAREQSLRDQLDHADQFRAAGQFEEAQSLYQRALSIDPRNDEARMGLKGMERRFLQKGKLIEARQALDAKDWTVAKDALASILADDPSNDSALSMRRELAELSSPAPVETGLAAAYKTPISIEFKEVPLKQAFEVISKTSGLNFVFDKDVKADTKTSIFLRNSTVESALYFLLLTNQLEQQVMNGNTLLIYPNSPNKVKDYQELSVRAFQMANTDAKSVATTLKTLFKGRDVVVDEKLNMLVVRDTPEALKMVEKIVALHDVAEPEVMLEVEVLEVSRNKLMDLGVRWPDGISFAPLASDSGTGLTIRDLRHLKYSTISAAVGNTTVNVHKQDSDVNILANPRIRVVNREKAKILIGDKLPLITSSITSTGVTSESINYLDVGLKLDVEPTIYRGNDIVIKVGLEVSSIGDAQVSKQGTTAYTIGTRNANTVLRLKDGENQILAGLINDEERRTANKIPGLGDLPVAGRLFGSTHDEGKKTEVILSITPHLVRNIQRPDAGVQEFRSGTESSLRERPISLEQNAPKAPADPTARGIKVGSGAPLAPFASQVGKPVKPGSALAVSASSDQAQPMMKEVPVLAIAGKSTRSRVEDGDEADAQDDDADAASVSLSWAGPESVTVGREFTLTLSANASDALTAMPVTVGFDSSMLEVVRVESGGWLGGDGSRVPFRSNVSNGRLTLAGSAPAGGITGGGNLARITFRGLSSGVAAKVSVVKATPMGRRGSLGAPALPKAHQVWIQ